MRKIRRKIARYNMTRQGIQHMNRKQADRQSFFSKHWKEYDEFFGI